MHMVPLLLSGFIGPLNPAIHGIRVASVLEFSVLCVFVLHYIFSNPWTRTMMYVMPIFLWELR